MGTFGRKANDFDTDIGALKTEHQNAKTDRDEYEWIKEKIEKEATDSSSDTHIRLQEAVDLQLYLQKLKEHYQKAPKSLERPKRVVGHESKKV